MSGGRAGARSTIHTPRGGVDDDDDVFVKTEHGPFVRVTVQKERVAPPAPPTAEKEKEYLVYFGLALLFVVLGVVDLQVSLLAGLVAVLLVALQAGREGALPVRDAYWLMTALAVAACCVRSDLAHCMKQPEVKEILRQCAAMKQVVKTHPSMQNSDKKNKLLKYDTHFSVPFDLSKEAQRQALFGKGPRTDM